MWSSLSLLNAVAVWGLWAAAISGGVAVFAGLVGGLAAIRASDITTKAANTEIARANAQAERAKRDAAEANQRAAEARAETAKTNERLQKAQEMRQLTKPQADALMPLLQSGFFQKDPRPWIRVTHVPDAEAQAFAYQLMDFFKACGVQQGQFGEAFQKVPNKTDLALALKSFETTEQSQPFARLQLSLRAVGWTVGTVQDPSLRDNEGVLIVLRKPNV